MALIPNYVVLVLNGERLAVFPIASVETMWIPVDSINEPFNYTLLADLPTILADDVPPEVTDSLVDPLTIMKFWAILGQLHRYELTVHRSGVSWELQGSILVPATFPLVVLYSGHFVHWNSGPGVRVQISPPQAGQDIPLNVPAGVHISPYSGTVNYSQTVQEGEVVVIIYYD
ncbi:hypothetical protein C8F04DRAFT_1280711 [Mycena alexandri]|uniref:Uncharacterized protein n=1 Tax=Mycena alexandri TaxID=1745969 RepID=A0AAD6RXK1_9AGAR|nr:hypothetical protein C8F04DRAFT_1280711 [Mycena alexandri]